MKIKILSSTAQNQEIDKEKYNILSGKIAGLCYMKDNFDSLENESVEKSEKRANFTKQNGHHSVFEHIYVSLLLEDVPKLFAMILNNQNVYVTSEKSARYTIMKMSDIEEQIYNKWKDIFVKLITEKYGHIKYFDEKRILKLSQENARYFLSVYTPTTMLYSVSYRQLNYLYGWLNNLENTDNNLLKRLVPYAKEFCKQLEEIGLIDTELSCDGKNRDINFFANKEPKEYYGDVYCTKYESSFASFAQAQRHRTLHYEILQPQKQEFFIPAILRNDENLKSEWLKDMDNVKENVPQGQIIEIVEKGTPENLRLKLYERCCTCAQQEIMAQSKQLIQNYIEKTGEDYYKEYFEKFSHGARCSYGDYKCKNPCQFKDGIDMTRDI